MSPDPAVTLVLLLGIGIIAGILFDRVAGPGWFKRQVSGSAPILVTTALVGIAGSFVGYHLALPNNVARRGVDGATNTSEAFVYSGVDPNTGIPTGLVSLGPVYSPNNEFGQSRDGRSFAPSSLKSHYQDTFALGAERNFTWADIDFNSGAKLTYSSLGSAIDDFCDSRPVYEWAETNGQQYTDAPVA